VVALIGKGGMGEVYRVRDIRGAVRSELHAARPPFDADRLAITGEPKTVARSVGSFLDTAFFAASPTTVVYRGMTSDVQLTWFDRRGKEMGKVAEPARFSRLALSPDGTRAVFVRENNVNRVDQDLWMLDLSRNTMTRLTTDPVAESAPAWTPDGREVWYVAGTGDGRIFRKLANGTGQTEVVLQSSTSPVVNTATTGLSLTASSRDGYLLSFSVQSPTGSKDDLWILPGAGGKPAPLLQQDFDQNDGHISPDGRWVAYVSNESGSNEVFVRALSAGNGAAPSLGPSVLVSRGGGQAPRWRADSGELLYQTSNGTIMAVSVAGGSFRSPIELFRLPGPLPDWDVSSDGQRFLVAVPTRQTAPSFSVILNWQTALT
jgi:Tol biopolymer transport system component